MTDHNTYNETCDPSDKNQMKSQKDFENLLNILQKYDHRQLHDQDLMILQVLAQ